MYVLIGFVFFFFMMGRYLRLLVDIIFDFEEGIFNGLLIDYVE